MSEKCGINNNNNSDNRTDEGKNQIKYGESFLRKNQIMKKNKSHQFMNEMKGKRQFLPCIIRQISHCFIMIVAICNN